MSETKPSVYERIAPALEAQRATRTTHWKCSHIQCGASYTAPQEKCDTCGSPVYAVGGVASSPALGAPYGEQAK
jgi:uncharacterized OB-fold protein